MDRAQRPFQKWLFRAARTRSMGNPMTFVIEPSMHSISRPLIFLRRITAGFVQGIDALEVSLKINNLPRAELHARGFDEAAEFPIAFPDETNAGENFMNATAKPLEHGLRFAQAGRLPEDLPLERNDSVCAQNNTLGELRGDFQSLALRVDQAKFSRRPVPAGEFFRARRFDFKSDACLSQQVVPSRRFGREEERVLWDDQRSINAATVRTGHFYRMAEN